MVECRRRWLEHFDVVEQLHFGLRQSSPGARYRSWLRLAGRVTRVIGESYTGKDVQLDAAVADLLKQLANTN